MTRPVPPASLPAVLEATFVAEARTAESVPAEGPPEIAIAGRSNVGKSTLLNRIAGRRALARTSKTPGRTRGAIFYDLIVRFPAQATGDGGAGAKTALRLVDLPGYGYAQVSQDERRRWQTLVEGYVERRAALRLFLVLIDARRQVEDEEQQLLEWLDTLGVPHQLVVTKVDKLSASERGSLAKKLRNNVPGVGLLRVSGETGEGIDQLWRAIQRACAPGGSPEAGEK